MNKKIILAFFSVIIIAAAVIIGIITKKPSGAFEKNIDLYFLNADESAIIAEKRKIGYDEEDNLCELVINELLKGPSDKKSHPIAQKNTKLLNFSLNNSKLTINFSEDFSGEDTTKNMLAVYAVVKTLCQIDKVTDVMVTAGSKPIRAADSSYIGFMSNSDINLESDMYTTDSKNIVLYFSNKDGTALSREVRTIKITDTRPIENYIISELLKGPVNKDLMPVITSDTELISAETTNGTCHVTFKNFIDKNLSDPSSKKSKLSVYAVVNSLTELDEVSSVRFLFEGKTAEMVGNFDFSDVFYKDEAIIID